MFRMVFLTKVLKEIIKEAGQVNWPLRSETIRLTTTILVVTVLVGLYIGVLDIFLAKALTLITSRSLG